MGTAYDCCSHCNLSVPSNGMNTNISGKKGNIQEMIPLQFLIRIASKFLRKQKSGIYKHTATNEMLLILNIL